MALEKFQTRVVIGLVRFFAFAGFVAFTESPSLILAACYRDELEEAEFIAKVLLLSSSAMVDCSCVSEDP